MAIFPKVQSPCPYKGELAAIMDGDMCRLCKREVFDLTDMTDGERKGLLSGCATEVCVSYRLPALAAAVMAAAALGAPAAAAAQDASPDLVELEFVFVGGITDMGGIEYVETEAEAAVPALPVVYDDEAEAPANAAGGQ